MPRVFITNDTGLNYTAAERFGELRSLTRGSVDPFRPHLAQAHIEAQLGEFNFETDFLLPAGSCLAAVFAGAFLASLEGPNERRLRLLLFDVKRGEYLERTVTI